MSHIQLKRTIAILSLCFAFSSPIHSVELYNYTFGAGFTPQTLSGGESGSSSVSPYFVLSSGFSINASRRLGPQLRFRLDFLSATIYSDSTATSIRKFGSEEISRIGAFKTRRVSASLQYFPFKNLNRITPTLGLGIGVDSWKFIDPISGATIDTISAKSLPKEFDAQELVLTSFAGLNVSLGSRIALALEGRADYLAGPGSEFADIVADTRPRLALSLSTRLQINFGVAAKTTKWNSDKSWTEVTQSTKNTPRRTVRDSDGDGVNDEMDKCPSTVVGAIVNSLGCPMDTDGDGVYDGLDDCAETPPGALGSVDIYGCPIDSDFDGIPDYMDACPASRIGAHVDETGCPLDSDKDGVADGLDDCPETTVGLEVDERGCVDMSIFSQVLILNISYQSGSFEVDSKSKHELDRLAQMLKAAPEIHLEIIGYTDNIGSASVNRTLSEKRARRVRDYLLSLKIPSERMKVRGRGETNFIADNSKASGRQKNRRIEILFQRK